MRTHALALVAIAACGGQAQRSGTLASSAPREASPLAGGATAEAAPDPPGLGTIFGEQRTSRIRETSFVRADDRPFAQVELRYNDEEGLRRQIALQGGPELGVTSPGGGIRVWLADADGSPLPGMHAGGRVYVLGEEGERYAIVVENQGGGRFEALLSVDGLDVVDGKPGDLRKRGYVVEPGGRLVVEGFRTSVDEVATFRFGRVRDSYAARTGSEVDVGVVGVALFAELGAPFPTDEVLRREAAEPFRGDPRFAAPPWR